MRLRVNGQDRAVEPPAGAMLLDVLRDDLRLTGSKAGCSRGECGACTVLVGDIAVMACVQLVALVDQPVTTIEGLAPQIEDLRAAFADCGGFQCGFCTSGQLVQAYALLQAGLPADRTEAERAVRHGMSGNICRCTGYAGIVEAIMRAAGHPPRGAAA